MAESLHGLEFFYAPPESIDGTRVRIDGEEFAHLTHVMRRREGDRIGILDGVGMAYTAVITALQQRSAVAEIRSTHPLLNESPHVVTLCVSLLKNPSRFDFLVEKATEAGVRTIVPVICERTIPRHARVDRWQKIALAGAKQCSRAIIPAVAPPALFPETIAAAPGDALRLLLHEQSSTPFPVPAEGAHASLVCVGPEGGFSERELHQAEALGWHTVGLGPRRLRTETAALLAAARLLL